MKTVLRLAAALSLGAVATVIVPAQGQAQGSNSTMSTGSNATGTMKDDAVKSDGMSRDKMSGGKTKGKRKNKM